MLLEYKSLPFELKELVDVSGGGWEIAGYASTFGGEADEYGDVIAPGAFKASIAARTPKHLFEHNQPIGKTLAIHEDSHGLFGRFSIIDTTVGTDAYKLAKAGVIDALSIGYRPVEWEYRDDGTRLLKTIDLYEVSSVAIPANKSAVITDVKSDGSKAVWSGSYVNSLPDSSFALIMPGGSKDSEGKTTPRSLRKLPHHASDGSVDMPHVRNGLSRAPQMTGVSDTQRSRAVSHLQKHLKSAAHYGVTHHKQADFDFDDDEGISTFAAGSYEALAEDLEEAYEAVVISSGQMGYVEIVATFADHFVAVVILLDANGEPNPITLEDPVYWDVPYTLAADGTIALGTSTQVEPEATFVPSDDGKSIDIHYELTTRRLRRLGILESVS